jgi:hypothetical protein
MSRLVAVVLAGTIGGSLIGCAAEGQARHHVTARPDLHPPILATVAHKPRLGVAGPLTGDAGTTRHPRSSRSRPITTGSTAWASGAFARRVVGCESGGDPAILDSHTGTTYFGKWQADADFVRTYDGSSAWSWVSSGRFTMPEWRQDAMAYRGWLARGWQPWECAGLVSR